MELIDKQELLDWIQNCWDWATVDGITSTTVLKQTMTDISQLPTVEAVPKDQYETRLKADMVKVLTELKTEIAIMSDSVVEGRAVTITSWRGMQKRICKLIQSKIDKLKGDADGDK